MPKYARARTFITIETRHCIWYHPNTKLISKNFPTSPKLPLRLPPPKTPPSLHPKPTLNSKSQLRQNKNNHTSQQRQSRNPSIHHHSSPPTPPFRHTPQITHSSRSSLQTQLIFFQTLDCRIEDRGIGCEGLGESMGASAEFLRHGEERVGQSFLFGAVVGEETFARGCGCG